MILQRIGDAEDVKLVNRIQQFGGEHSSPQSEHEAGKFAQGDVDIYRESLRARAASTISKASVSSRNKVLLVPTDFSDSARFTTDYALKMAQKAGAGVVLVHAVNLNLAPIGPANPAWLRGALCQEATEKAGEFLRKARQLGVDATSVVEEGSPAQVIIRCAKRWHAHLIIMTETKRSFLGRFFSRTALKPVLEQAGCAVMLYQTNMREGIL